MKNKNFKAVEFMRKRRKELSKKYIENPKEAEKNLKHINEKYGIGTVKHKNRISRMHKKDKVF